MKENRKDRSGRSKLVIDGNAFYELDLDCVRRREEHRKKQTKEEHKAGKKGSSHREHDHRDSP